MLSHWSDTINYAVPEPAIGCWAGGRRSGPLPAGRGQGGRAGQNSSLLNRYLHMFAQRKRTTEKAKPINCLSKYVVTKTLSVKTDT